MRYRLPKKSVRLDYLFNMFGSTANAAVSILLLIVVSRVLGEEEAGVFTLCFSTAQMMYIIGEFELRSVQVTDAKEEYSFGHMIAFRLLTTAAMLIATFGFMLFHGFAGEKLIVMLLLTLYMAVLSLADVFQGDLHYQGYLFLAGLGLGGEVLSAAFAFLITLVITRNLALSILPMIGAALLWLFLYEIPFAESLTPARPRFEGKKLLHLLLTAAPLAISVFLNQFVFNAPKFAIDTFLTEADQSHYGFLVMPSFVINLLSLFVFRPRLVALAEQWHNDRRTFFRQVRRLYVWVALATALTVLAGFAAGISVLNFLYNARLNDYRFLLVLLLLGGGFSAGCTLSVTLLAVIRKQAFGLIGYGAAALLALFLPDLFVRHFGFAGAAYAFLTEAALLFICLIVIFTVCAHTHERTQSTATEEYFEIQ